MVVFDLTPQIGDHLVDRKCFTLLTPYACQMVTRSLASSKKRLEGADRSIAEVTAGEFEVPSGDGFSNYVCTKSYFRTTVRRAHAVRTHREERSATTCLWRLAVHEKWSLNKTAGLSQELQSLQSVPGLSTMFDTDQASRPPEEQDIVVLKAPSMSKWPRAQIFTHCQKITNQLAAAISDGPCKKSIRDGVISGGSVQD
jgi:hypothetical protein